MFYVAGWNTPGYLPESDPAIFDNETDAIRYLSDNVERFWDEDYAERFWDEDYAIDTTWTHWNEIDDKWSAVFANLPYEAAPFNICNNDRSLSFWVAVVSKSDLPYNSEGN